MTFSRSHAGMVGIISLFTGMIAPIAGVGGTGYPLPLTDMQTIAYIVLFTLAIGFYLVSIRNWGWFRLVGLILLILIGYISVIVFSGELHSISGGTPLTEIRWGWVFLIIGGVALLYTTLTSGDQDDSEGSIFSDAIIGIVGTLVLIGLSALIIGASIGGGDKKGSQSLLSQSLGAEVIHGTGITMSAPYGSVGDLFFERKKDLIKFLEVTESGNILHPDNILFPGSAPRLYNLIGKSIVQSDAGVWVDTIPLGTGEQLSIRDNTMLLKKSDTLEITTSEKNLAYPLSGAMIETVRISEENNIPLWVSKIGSGYEIIKNGKSISDTYRNISNLSISRSGYDTIGIAKTNSGETVVLKNGTPTEVIRSGYREGSFISNGSHSLYITEESGLQRVIYDGVSTGKDFLEVREVFIEKSGNAYAFFARPLGSNEYCLFTRYRGNICGLSGYMNPRLSADGSTVLYAGLRDGIWGIYRNTDTVIRDTGYASNDITDDYVFFDVTNPKQYVFLEKGEDTTYKIRKNGKLLPQAWKDVGLDVTFGYDNIAIMSVQDDTGWHVIEF